MPKGTFTEGRLESFERMMQSLPGRMKDYEPPKQQRKKEKLRQRRYQKQK